MQFEYTKWNLLTRFCMIFVTHNIRYNCGDTDSNQSKKGNHEIDRPEDVLDNIALEGDLSPRLSNSATKGKKQGNWEQCRAMRVHPKKSKFISQKYEIFNMKY